MSGIRMIDMNANFRREEDGSFTLMFTLKGLASHEEASAFTDAVAPKLRKTIVHTLKKRGNKIYAQKD